jgi:hypothetical protein
LIAVVTGSIMSLPIIWAFADVAMGVLTLLNVTTILLLSAWAIAVLADYQRSLVGGRKPLPWLAPPLVCPLCLGKPFGRPAVIPAIGTWR